MILNDIDRHCSPELQKKSVIPFFFETWLAGRLKLGKQHPNTMMTIYNLAVLLKSMKKFEEAEELFREHLAACNSPSMLSMSFSSSQPCEINPRWY